MNKENAKCRQQVKKDQLSEVSGGLSKKLIDSIVSRAAADRADGDDQLAALKADCDARRRRIGNNALSGATGGSRASSNSSPSCCSGSEDSLRAKTS